MNPPTIGAQSRAIVADPVERIRLYASTARSPARSIRWSSGRFGSSTDIKRPMMKRSKSVSDVIDYDADLSDALQRSNAMTTYADQIRQCSLRMPCATLTAQIRKCQRTKSAVDYREPAADAESSVVTNTGRECCRGKEYSSLTYVSAALRCRDESDTNGEVNPENTVEGAIAVHRLSDQDANRDMISSEFLYVRDTAENEVNLHVSPSSPNRQRKTAGWKTAAGSKPRSGLRENDSTRNRKQIFPTADERNSASLPPTQRVTSTSNRWPSSCVVDYCTRDLSDDVTGVGLTGNDKSTTRLGQDLNGCWRHSKPLTGNDGLIRSATIE